MRFRVRVDATSEVNSEALTQWAMRKSNRYVVMHHLVHENSHFHLYLDCEDTQSPQSLRYKLKSYFHLLPVEFSVGECDEARIDEYLSYLYNTKHGNVATLIATNLPDYQMDTARNAASAISEQYAKSVKKKTKSLYDIALEVRSAADDDEERSDTRAVIHHAIRLLHKYLKCHDSYLVKRVVETVLSMQNPMKYEQYILSMISV